MFYFPQVVARVPFSYRVLGFISTDYSVMVRQEFNDEIFRVNLDRRPISGNATDVKTIQTTLTLQREINAIISEC